MLGYITNKNINRQDVIQKFEGTPFIIPEVYTLDITNPSFQPHLCCTTGFSSLLQFHEQCRGFVTHHIDLSLRKVFFIHLDQMDSVSATRHQRFLIIKHLFHSLIFLNPMPSSFLSKQMVDHDTKEPPLCNEGSFHRKDLQILSSSHIMAFGKIRAKIQYS
ncbi:hypothetical protein Droror1_Dr00000046 [Drosera rotundifolia]